MKERQPKKKSKSATYRSRRVAKALLCVRGKMTDMLVYDNSIMERKRRELRSCSEKAWLRAYSPFTDQIT